MNKALIGENVRRLREKRGLSVNELARRAGVDRGNMSKLETGNAGASLETLARIAATLKVSLASLLDEGGNVQELTGGLRKIPIIPWSQIPAFAEKKHPRGSSMPVVVLHNVQASPETYALMLEDDSMEPDFSAGDILIVDPERKPRPGSYVIACVGPQAFFRQYRDLGENGCELLPLNQLYPILRSGRLPIKVVGTVISYRRDLEK